MPTLMEFPVDGGAVLVDVTPGGDGVRPVGALDTVVKKAETSFDAALKMAGTIARSFQRVMSEYALDKAELELGFQFTGKGNIYLVQAEAQAALKVKVTFDRSLSPSNSQQLTPSRS